MKRALEVLLEGLCWVAVVAGVVALTWCADLRLQ